MFSKGSRSGPASGNATSGGSQGGRWNTRSCGWRSWQSGSSQGTDSGYDGCHLTWGWRGMKRWTSWLSRGGCGIHTMKIPPRNDAALSSSGRSWGSRRCLLGRGRPATVGFRIAQGACLGRGIRQGHLRVWALKGGWTARNAVRMSVIIPGRGARWLSHLWWRLAAP